MTGPRKRSKMQSCLRHAGTFATMSRRRAAEVFVEGGPGGPCANGLCRLWPGTDFYAATYCTGELALDWTIPAAQLVSISYSVPVMVTVDLETKEVTRVRIIGEGITADREGFSENAETFGRVRESDEQRAYDVAENADWPGWES
jgi:hypothetical protein